MKGAGKWEKGKGGWWGKGAKGKGGGLYSFAEPYGSNHQSEDDLYQYGAFGCMEEGE